MANEMRLIDANRAKRRIIAFATGCHTEVLSVDSVVMMLNQEDTVDAIPAAHSKWSCVNEDENVWMCDGIEGCGGEMIILEKTPLENGFHFCPYCGADMRDCDGNG